MSSVASSNALLLVTASHDLKSPASVDHVKDSALGMNQPVERKYRIFQKVTENPSVLKRIVDTPKEDLSLATGVHEPGFTDFLNTAFDRWSAIPDSEKDTFFGGGGTRKAADFSSFVPAQVAPRDSYQRPGPSVFGQCCYYAMDRLTPIKENTAKTLRADLAVSETAVQAILKGDAQFVYALTTEPGHHSGPRSYGGYCFINQAAVCADLLAKAGKFKRVGLLDVDFHSGNGSLAIFYEREDVFFASLHMNPDLDYPYNCGFADQRGEGKGAGWTINVPLNCGVTWPVYRVEMLKVLDSFKAAGCDCLVVSLGLDTVSGDPEASPIATMELKVPDYLEMGEIIRKFNKPTIFVQEGGYRLEVVAEAARNVVDPQAGREEYQNKQ